MMKICLPFSDAKIEISDDEFEMGDFVRDYINEQLCIAIKSGYAEMDRKIMEGDGTVRPFQFLNL